MNASTLFLAAAAAVANATAQPVITHTDVFTAGKEGYHTFRIPTIVTTNDGTLIAFAEGRKDNSRDPGNGDIDLVFKRSADNGRTWPAVQVLDDPGEKWGASNPTAVVDRSNGRVLLLYNRWEPGIDTPQAEVGTMKNQTWMRTSDDQGRTWSAARDLTRDARDYDHWAAMFLGPGGAIQTRTGRLIVPAAMSPDTYYVWASFGAFSGRMEIMRSYALYSDDHGSTWRRGGLLGAFTNECQVVELADGAIMMDARQDAGDRRWVVISQNGGQTWSRPRAGQAVSPIATAIERYTSKAAGDDRDRLLWTGITGPGRKGLVIRVSYDEGQTFSNEHLLYGGYAAYSDLTILRDKTVGILWERGVSDSYQSVTFTRLNRDFLEPPGTAVPTFR
ncbi:MAG: exo-alpha-sialidase [Bryobacteraceae bacterium]